MTIGPGDAISGRDGAPDQARLPTRAPMARQAAPHRLDARPRVVEDPGILGLSRRTRSRFGSRLFTLFFAFVYALILIQLLVTLLQV